MSLVRAMVAPKGGNEIQIRFCWGHDLVHGGGNGSGLVVGQSDTYYSPCC